MAAGDDGEEACNDKQLFLWHQSHGTLGGWYISVLPEWRSEHPAFFADGPCPAGCAHVPYDARKPWGIVTVTPFHCWAEAQMVAMSELLQATNLQREELMEQVAELTAKVDSNPTPVSTGWFNKCKFLLRAYQRKNWRRLDELATEYAQHELMAKVLHA